MAIEVLQGGPTVRDHKAKALKNRRYYAPDPLARTRYEDPETKIVSELNKLVKRQEERFERWINSPLGSDEALEALAALAKGETK